MSRESKRHEKEMIVNDLFHEGKILFSTFGFKKTTISDITTNVGIAQGTFYQFFHSKEELYFTILETEEERIKQQITNRNYLQAGDPKKAMKNMLQEMVLIMETNLLIRELYFGNTLQQIIKKLPSERLENHFKKDTTTLLTLFQPLKEAGFVLDKTPELTAGILRALF